VTLSLSDFSDFHCAVHGGKRPFSWQVRLLERVVGEKSWPHVLDLPTGVGKTTCIDIAVFALALDASSEIDSRWCPRRVAMVVDRRIVVDQAAERGRKLLAALMSSRVGVVGEVARRLRSLTRSGEEPLGVYTLRGGMPLDDGWARTPDQPLVIASTVDQLGSRLLMQGYGVSQGMLPVHAGLLANDTLLLLDEVHLSEPFRQTLDQLACLRARFSGSRLNSRFLHTFLSATPGDVGVSRFGLLQEEKEPSSPLGPRLHANKPVRIVEVDDRGAMEQACLEQAESLLKRHRTIAVVVNRVASASLIARNLEERVGKDVAVTLLTGRMRPLDRDDVLRELRPCVFAGRLRSETSHQRVIVSTQCIEAGADYDFDALVTEAASLDALRQRFGRVDRLGHYGRAEGVLVYDGSTKDDPIYGAAITETMKWLKSEIDRRRKRKKSALDEEMKRRKDGLVGLKGAEKRLAESCNRAFKQASEESIKTKPLDFGVLELEVPEGDCLSRLLAPKSDAPILLPAYLDMWVQTSPPPSQVPDVSLWLHGPKSGPADVQVVWRADLSEGVLQDGDLDTAVSIVSAVRPSSLEAVAVPFVTVRNWLANCPSEELGDTEGHGAHDSSATLTSRSSGPSAAGGRVALRWMGDQSVIVFPYGDGEAILRPGDTIVVPATYGGIRSGCFDPTSLEPVQDRAEQAELFARGRPVLRLQPDVIENLQISVSLEDPEESRKSLRRLAEMENRPEWMRFWGKKLAIGRGQHIVKAESTWIVLEANRVAAEELRKSSAPEESVEIGVDVTTEGDVSYFLGRPVSLSEHCSDVECFAREYARQCGFGDWLVEHIALAGWLHDVGKADRRFQVMLRGGNEIDFFKDETPWAKSGIPAGARAARRFARERSRYPTGGYVHAVTAVAMVNDKRDVLAELLRDRTGGRDPDLDLVLYLIASHHGEGRPLAPVVIDEAPIEVSLLGHRSSVFGAIDFAGVPSNPPYHRVDSPFADRFWTLVGRYGWHELCWIESILRLADHRASEEEQMKEVFP
jgi:CRISPR-associated endonuclease/helicase Cas3